MTDAIVSILHYTADIVVRGTLTSRKDAPSSDLPDSSTTSSITLSHATSQTE